VGDNTVCSVYPIARTVPATRGGGAEGMLGCTNGCEGVLCFTLTYHLGVDGVRVEPW
jgi:hypothetical protein